jgi:hypothetical protein
LGRVRDGFGALERDGWYFGKASAKVRKRVERALLDAIEPLSAKVTVLDARPLTTKGPHPSPLSFDADGTLTVRTIEGATRYDASGMGTPLTLEAPLPPLEARVGGRLLTGVVYSCDRSEVTLAFDSGAPVATTLLSARPGVCGRSSFEPPLVPRPVAIGAGLSALVGATLVGDAGAGAVTPVGSARSADGRGLAVRTPYGLLLDGSSHRLLDLGATRDPAGLWGCVPANGGRRAACVHRGQAVLIDAPG